MNQSKSRGFTFIELSFVVTIIGILAAIAIPAYSQYTTKAKLSEALTIVAPIQSAFVEYYQRWGAIPGNADIAGMGKLEQYSGKYLNGVRYDNGVIYVDLNSQEFGTNQKVFWLAAAVEGDPPYTTIQWVCSMKSVTQNIHLLGHVVIPPNSEIEDRLKVKDC